MGGEGKAAHLARVEMDLTWGLRGVIKRKVWNRRGTREEEEGITVPDIPPVMVVKRKDAA